MYNTKDDRSDHKVRRWTTNGAGDHFITKRIWFEDQAWPMIDTPESVVSSDLGIRTIIPMTSDIVASMMRWAKDGPRS